jgi:hypothetical protein
MPAAGRLPAPRPSMAVVVVVVVLLAPVQATQATKPLNQAEVAGPFRESLLASHAHWSGPRNAGSEQRALNVKRHGRVDQIVAAAGAGPADRLKLLPKLYFIRDWIGSCLLNGPICTHIRSYIIEYLLYRRLLLPKEALLYHVPCDATLMAFWCSRLESRFRSCLDPSAN